MNSEIAVIDIPSTSFISRDLQGADFFDAYELVLTHSGQSALEIYMNSIIQTPWWINFLMGARNRMVSLLGLKNLGRLGDLGKDKRPADYRVGDRVGIFSLIYLSDEEIILSDSDRHLDVKVSVCKLIKENRESVVVSTVVHIHNRLGRIYMFFVAPLHRIIVPTVLQRVNNTHR